MTFAGIQMFRTLIRVLAALVLAGVFAACASTGRIGVPQPSSGQALPIPDAARGAAFVDGDEYRIGAQDLIEISVLGVPDLSRTVRVNADGRISLPLVGTWPPAGARSPNWRPSWRSVTSTITCSGRR